MTINFLEDSIRIKQSPSNITSKSPNYPIEYTKIENMTSWSYDLHKNIIKEVKGKRRMQGNNIDGNSTFLRF